MAKPFPRLRRILVRSSIAIAVLAAVLYVTRERTLGPLIVRLARPLVARHLQAGLEVGQISGNWLTHLVLRDVALAPLDETRPPLVRLERGELELRYSPWKLLTAGLDGILEVRLAAGALELFLPDEAAPSESEPAGESGSALPEALPRLSADVELLRVVVGEADVFACAGLAVRSPGDGAPTTLRARDVAVAGLLLEAFETDLLLEPQGVRIAHLLAKSGANVLEGRDLTLPLDAGGPSDVLRRLEGRLSLSAEDLPHLLAADVPAAPPHRITLEGRLGAGVLTLEEGRVKTVGGTLTLSRGELRLDEGSTLEKARVALELTVDFDELGELARLFGEERIHGRLQGALAVSGALGRPRGRLEGSVSELVAFERAIGDGELAATLERGLLTVEHLELDGPLGRLSAHGAYDGPGGQLRNLRLDARLFALGQLGLSGLVGGEASVSATLDGPPTRPTGAVSLEAEGVRWSDALQGTVSLACTLEGDVARVERLRVQSEVGRLEATGRLAREPDTGWTATVTTLEATRGPGRLTLGEPCSLCQTSAGGWSLSPLVLEGNAGRVRAEAERSPEGLQASLVCEDFDPLPLTATTPFVSWRTTGVNADVSVTLREGGLSARYDVSVPYLRTAPDDEPWTALARGALDGGRLRVERLVLEHARVGTLVAEAELPLDPLAAEPLTAGELQLASSLDLDLAELGQRLAGLPAGVAGTVRADVALAGPWQAATGSLLVAGEGLALSFLGAPFAERTAEVELELRATAERCLLGPARLAASGLGTIDATGSLGSRLDLRALLGGDVAAWRTVPVDLHLDLALDDIGVLARSTEAVRRLEGRVSGRLDVGGSLSTPRFDGTLDLTDGTLRLAGGVPPLEALSANLRFHEREVTLEGLRGELGASPFVAEGTVRLDGDEPGLTLRLSGENLLLARQSGLRLRADADVEVTGPLSGLQTTGKVALTSGRYGRDIDFLGALRGESGPPSAGGRGFLPAFWRDGPLAQMTFDVQLRSVSPLVVANNVADVEVRPELRLTGTGEVPLLEGTVYIDPGRLSLPSGALAIDAGLISFSRQAPFAPRLELTGRTRIRGYDIGVRVSGDVQAPEIELWSTPSLPGDDLLVLFLTGELPEGAVGDAAAQSVAVYLAKDYLVRWLGGDDEGGESVLERLVIEVGTDVTRSGAPTTEVVYYFSSRPRQVGWAPYLTAERDKYDRYNLGVGLVFRLR